MAFKRLLTSSVPITGQKWQGLAGFARTGMSDTRGGAQTTTGKIRKRPERRRITHEHAQGIQTALRNA